MIYKDKFEDTEHGIAYVTHKVEQFTEDGFIASLYMRNYSEIDILLRIADVRECLSISHREFLGLTKFAMDFNTRFATENNKRFSTAQQMLNRLRSSLASVKRYYRESCPIRRKQQPTAAPFSERLRPSVFERSVLTYGGCARDLFGIQSFNDNIQTLYIEQRALFANVLAALVLCYHEIENEKAIKADPDKCVLLLERQCQQIQNDLRDTIDLMQCPVTCEIQELIDNMGKREFARQGFHEHDLKELKTYAVYDAIQRGAKSNIGTTAALLFSGNLQKGKDAELLIEHFDEFRTENRKKVSSLKVLLFVNWCGGTVEAPKQMYYKLLKTYYRCKALPEWHSVVVVKNKTTDLQALQKTFNAEANDFLTALKEVA